MLVKKLLVALPIVMVLVIIVSAFLGPPWVGKDTENESRMDTFVVYITSDLEQLNPWLTSKTNDSDFAAKIFEALVAVNADYQLEPELAKKLRINEEAVLILDKGEDQEAIKAKLEPALREAFPNLFVGFKTYDARAYRGHTGEFPTGEFLYDLRNGGIKTQAAVDGLGRIVMRFEPNESNNYGPMDMPSAVVSGLRDVIQAVLEKPDRYFDGYNTFETAVNRYIAVHELDATAFTIPGNPHFSSRDSKRDQEPEDKTFSEWSPDDNETDEKASSSVDPALVVAWKKELEELKKTLIPSLTKAAQAKSQDAASFADFLVGVQEARLVERPTVSFTLHQDVRWHDYGTLVPLYLENGRSISELRTKDGEALPDRLESKEDWEKWGNRLIEVELPSGLSGARRTERFNADESASDIASTTTTYYRTETLDVDDVAFSLMFGGDPKVVSNIKLYVDAMIQLRAYDDLQGEIVYRQVFSPALGNLAGAYIIPEHRLTREEWVRQSIVEGSGPDNPDDPAFNPREVLPAKKLQFSKDPIGTNFWKLFPLNGDALPRWRNGELATLERYEEYWRPEYIPSFKYKQHYIFDPSLGQETSEIVFRAGGSDIYGTQPYQAEGYINRRDQYTVYKRIRLNYDYIAFNMDREPFGNQLVRQALTMALDIDEIIDYINYGQAVRVSGPAYPVLPWYNENYVPDYTFRTGERKGKTMKELDLKFFPYAPSESAALLEEAGYELRDGKLMKDGKQFSFTIAISGISTPRGKVAQLAKQRWEELGIAVDIEDSEWNVFVNQRALVRNYDVVVLGWGNGVSFDKRRLWSKNFISPAGMNFVGFHDETAEKLMTAATLTYDNAEITRMSHELFNIIADQNPYIFTYAVVSNIIVDRHIVWRRPVIENGAPKRDDNGEIVFEDVPVNHEDAMKTKVGPHFFMDQWARTKAVKFERDDSRLAFAGRTDTWNDLLKAKEKGEE